MPGMRMSETITAKGPCFFSIFRASSPDIAVCMEKRFLSCRFIDWRTFSSSSTKSILSVIIPATLLLDLAAKLNPGVYMTKHTDLFKN
jgi:hypothetical protein